MEKEKYVISVSLQNVSPVILWSFLGTSKGLSEWFADSVEISGKQYTFIWNKIPQTATQLNIRISSFIRFRWNDDEPDTKYYFEFRIVQSELTGETVLEVIDFAEPDDRKDSIELWNKQLGALKRALGVV